MKARLFFSLVLAALMLGSGRVMVAMAQQMAGENTLVHSLTPEAEVYPLANYTPDLTGPIQSTSSGITIFINSDGLQPSQVTIPTGQVVTWVNQTSTTLHLNSGYPNQVYLPLVLRNVGTDNSTSTALTAKSLTVWGGEIVPGGIYTYTFTEAGDYPYFFTHHPDWMGRVVVQPPGQGRNLNEIARGIRILASVQDIEGTCPSKPWPSPYWAYYESEAFLDHGFGNSFLTSHHLELNGANRVIGYRAQVKDDESPGSPHSFQHHLQGIALAGNDTYYTSTFTSTLFASFAYSVTLSYSGLRPVHFTVIKDYGNGETYRIELANIEYWDPLRANIKSYVATVYGGVYSGTTQTVNGIGHILSPPVFCN